MIAHAGKAEQLPAKCLELPLSLPGFGSPVLHKKQAQVIDCAQVVLPTGAQGQGHFRLEGKVDGDSSRYPTAVPVSTYIPGYPHSTPV